MDGGVSRGRCLHRKKKSAVCEYQRPRKARGALIGAITAKLERKDAGHQMRWDLLWSDPEAQKLRHPDHADYWLWGHAFFEADMADLEHVAGLIGARR